MGFCFRTHLAIIQKSTAYARLLKAIAHFEQTPTSAHEVIRFSVSKPLVRIGGHLSTPPAFPAIFARTVSD
jgi:hypothetical protein